MPRHIPQRKVCQEHFSKRPLHCGVQEPTRSIGGAKCSPSIVSRHLEKRLGSLPRRHLTPVRLFNAGPTSLVRRHRATVESSSDTRRLDPLLSTQKSIKKTMTSLHPQTICTKVRASLIYRFETLETLPSPPPAFNKSSALCFQGP